MSELSKLIDRVLDGEKVTVSDYTAGGSGPKAQVDSIRLVTDELVIEYYQGVVKLGYLEIHRITGGAAFAEAIFRLKAKPWMTYEVLGVTMNLIEGMMMLFGHTDPKHAMYPGKGMSWGRAEQLAQRYAQHRAIEKGILSPALLAKPLITAEELIAGRTYEEMEAANATP